MYMYYDVVQCSTSKLVGVVNGNDCTCSSYCLHVYMTCTHLPYIIIMYRCCGELKADQLNTALVWKFQILKVFLNLIILAWTVLKFCRFSSLGVLRRGVLRRPILLYGFCCSIAIFTSGDGRRLKKVKGVRVDITAQIILFIVLLFLKYFEVIQ